MFLLWAHSLLAEAQTSKKKKTHCNSQRLGKCQSLKATTAAAHHTLQASSRKAHLFVPESCSIPAPQAFVCLSLHASNKASKQKAKER